MVAPCKAGLPVVSSNPTPPPDDIGHRRPEQPGRFALHDVADYLDGPTAPEPGGDSTDHQLPLLADVPVSVVPYPQLVELAEKAIRVESRKVYQFDWDALVADRPEWRLTEVVHRKAVQQARNRGLDVQPSDVPTDTVLTAVQSVISLWSRQPELRPTEDDFAQEQARRGEHGRESREANTAGRDVRMRALAAEGVPNAEIARRLDVNRSTVGLILGKANATPPAALQPELPAFPAPELPLEERWAVNQFTNATGVQLEASEAVWLADWGRCYEADGAASELIAAIAASAGAAVDPWAYLVRCVANRYDAWTINPQLLADVLSWAGRSKLEYCLIAIAGGYVQRPLPYLRRTLQSAVAQGKPPDTPARPVALAMHLAQRWAPELAIDGADVAVAAEDAAARTGYIDDYRRRHGRLPSEDAPVDAPDCCNGLKGYGGDDPDSEIKKQELLTSSPPYPKAIATPEPEKVEQPSNPAIWPDSAPIGGDPRPAQPQKSFRRHWDTFVAPRASPRLEHGQAGDGLGRHAPE